jgi:hypothetical protein
MGGGGETNKSTSGSMQEQKGGSMSRQGEQRGLEQKGTPQERGLQQKGAQQERGLQPPKGAQQERSTTNNGAQQQQQPSTQQQRGTQQQQPSVSGGATTTETGKAGVSTSTQTGARGGSVQLSENQRSQIKTIIGKESAPRISGNVTFDVRVGTRIPRSVHVVVLPEEIVRIVPQYRGYDYVLVGDEILIIDPRTLEIVSMILV